MTRTSLIRIRSLTRIPLLMDAPSFGLRQPRRREGWPEFFLDYGNQFVDRHDTQVLPAALSYRDGAGRGLFVAYHENIGDFLHFGIPDLEADLLVPSIHLRTRLCRSQPVGHLAGIGLEAVRHRDDPGLHRGKPHREGPGVMLDQDTEESLQRPEEGTVNHEGPMRPVIVPHIGDIETLRQVEVELDGRALPGPTEGILHLQVDLRPIEGTAPLLNLILESRTVSRQAQRLGCLVPQGRVPDRLLRSSCDTSLVLGEAKCAQEEQAEIDGPGDFFHHLLGRAKDMRVVLSEPPNAQEAVKHPGTLEAMHRAKLGKAQREVPVTADLRLEHLDMEGAVHRSDVVVVPFHLHPGVHLLAVEVQMATGLPQLRSTDLGRIDEIVAVLEVLLPPEVLDEFADQGSFRMPQDEAAAYLVVHAEKVQIAAEPAMIPSLRLLKAEEMLL